MTFHLSFPGLDPFSFPLPLSPSTLLLDSPQPLCRGREGGREGGLGAYSPLPSAPLQGLKPMDFNGLADPYVKLHLLPGACKVTSSFLP